MGSPKFARPKEGAAGGRSPNLFVANCGPAVGVSPAAIEAVFRRFGEVKGVHAADESGARVIVCYADEASAVAAMGALGGRPCSELNGRCLHIRYSVLQPAAQVKDSGSLSVSLDAAELNIPGLHLVKEFVSAEEEKFRMSLAGLTRNCLQQLMPGRGMASRRDGFSTTDTSFATT